jgi:hypothetical protein
MSLGGRSFSAVVRGRGMRLLEFGVRADEQHRHFPVARPLRIGWHWDINGRWAFDDDDRRKWEVVCEQCGDTDGPVAQQTQEVQLLRGSYRSKRKAKRVEIAHFSDN